MKNIILTIGIETFIAIIFIVYSIITICGLYFMAKKRKKGRKNEYKRY